MLCRAMRRAALAILFLAASCGPAAPVERLTADPDPIATQERVEAIHQEVMAQSGGLRVIDGDTFELQHETFRLANIDTPEMPPRHRCDEELLLALEATALHERIWSESRPLRPVIRREGRDRYGRTLARVSLDGGETDVGETLIRLRVAVPWEGRRHDWCGAR